MRNGLNHSLCLHADPKVLDLSPQGATLAYAAPEVLRCLQLQQEGTADAAHALINGPSADWWSVGVVLYELLTGERPCDNQPCSSVNKAPDNVPSHGKAQWEDYECVLTCHRTWVSTLWACVFGAFSAMHPHILDIVYVNYLLQAQLCSSERQVA